MQHPHDGLHTGAPSVPTALVVDDSFAGRARITTLLHLGGWRVHQAVGTEDALRLAALIEPRPGRDGDGDAPGPRGHPDATTAGAGLLGPLPGRGRPPHPAVPGAGRSGRRPRVPGQARGPAAVRGRDARTRARRSLHRRPGRRRCPSPSSRRDRTPPRCSSACCRTGCRRSRSALRPETPAGVGRDRCGARRGRATGWGMPRSPSSATSIARDARRGTVSHGRLVALVELCARLDPASQAATSR